MLEKQTQIRKKLTEREFRLFCSLLMEEDGQTLRLLSEEFKYLINEPEWMELVYSEDPFFSHPRIKELLREINLERLERSFKNLLILGDDNVDLEKGLFLLSSFNDPRVDPHWIGAALDTMAHEFQHSLNGVTQVDELISKFREYVFDKKEFHGNTYNYYDPDNSFLHKVLERRTGIPISLSCICLLLAKRVHWRGKPLPLVGIGLPSHFIIQFRFPEKNVFLDPYNRGRVITRKDCIEILAHQEIGFKESYLAPVNAYAIVCRTMNNLLQIYTHSGDEEKKNQLLKLLQILNGDEMILED